MHGLWPDSSFGRDPQNCQYGVSIPGGALRLTDGVYPDEGLARYEYLKHGTCSGLDPQAYFAAVKSLRDGIVVPDMLKAPRQRLTLAPDDLEQAFIAANANLRADNMAITCRNGELVDVRILRLPRISAPSPIARKSRATPATRRRSPSRRSVERAMIGDRR